MCTLSPHMSLETFLSFSTYFVPCSASRSRLAITMLSRAELRTIQPVLSCGTKSCSLVMKAMGHFQTLYPTAGAQGAANGILRRVGDFVSGCAAAGELEFEDPNSKPEGIPLASLSAREARSVLGIGSRPRGPRSVMSDFSAFHVKDVMDMDLDEVIQKYNRTVRVAGLLRYMLEADHGLTEEAEQKTWTLVRQWEFQKFQAWKRHKVWCYLRYACDTRCLFHCPWRPLVCFARLRRSVCCLSFWLLGRKPCSPRFICILC